VHHQSPFKSLTRKVSQASCEELAAAAGKQMMAHATCNCKQWCACNLVGVHAVAATKFRGTAPLSAATMAPTAMSSEQLGPSGTVWPISEPVTMLGGLRLTQSFASAGLWAPNPSRLPLHRCWPPASRFPPPGFECLPPADSAGGRPQPSE
jgi:hypothetical protein